MKELAGKKVLPLFPSFLLSLCWPNYIYSAPRSSLAKGAFSFLPSFFSFSCLWIETTAKDWRESEPNREWKEVLAGRSAGPRGEEQDRERS